MNSLSWLIYASDMLDGAKGVAMVIAPLSFLSAAGVGIIAALNKYDKTIGGGDRVADPLFRTTKNMVIVGSVAVAVAVMAPSRSTIMMIAASEVGETVLASSEAQKIGGEAGALATDSLRVLRKFINEQLDEKSE